MGMGSGGGGGVGYTLHRLVNVMVTEYCNQMHNFCYVPYAVWIE